MILLDIVPISCHDSPDSVFNFFTSTYSADNEKMSVY